MAPNTDPGGGALDRLMKKSQDMAIVRQREDAELRAIRANEDMVIGSSRHSKLEALEKDRETQFANQKTTINSAMDARREAHRTELAELHLRQEQEINSLVNKDKEKRAEITTKYKDLKDGILREAGKMLEARRREDTGLKRKREAETAASGKELLKIAEAGVRQSRGSTEEENSSTNKRNGANEDESTAEKEVVAIRTHSELNKRQKIYRQPELEAPNDAPPRGANRDTISHFEIKNMCVDYPGGLSELWSADQCKDQTELRALHHNPLANTFELYTGKENLNAKYPDSLFCIDGRSSFYFDNELKRLVTGSHRKGWLQLEFYDYYHDELQLFLEACRTHFPNANFFAVSLLDCSGIGLLYLFGTNVTSGS